MYLYRCVVCYSIDIDILNKQTKKNAPLNFRGWFSPPRETYVFPGKATPPV